MMRSQQQLQWRTVADGTKLLELLLDIRGVCGGWKLEITIVISSEIRLYHVGDRWDRTFNKEQKSESARS